MMLPILLLGLLAGTAAAQPAALSGTVTRCSDDHAVHDAVVMLWTGDGLLAATGTDSTGTYHFDRVDRGTYRLRAQVGTTKGERHVLIGEDDAFRFDVCVDVAAPAVIESPPPPVADSPAEAAARPRHRPARVMVGFSGGSFFPGVEGFGKDYVKDPLFSGFLGVRVWRVRPTLALYGTGQAHRFVASLVGSTLSRWEVTNLDLGLRLVLLDTRWTQTRLWTGSGLTRFNGARRTFSETSDFVLNETCRCYQTITEQIITENPLDAAGLYVEIGQEIVYVPSASFIQPGLFWTVRYDAVSRNGEAIGGVSASVGLTLNL